MVNRHSKDTLPNFLFINVDQLSREAIAANGCAYVQTPNMDRLMASGTSFDLSYCANPVCCPARSSWWTGKMSSETGVVDNAMPIRQDLPDMGQWLRDAGYATYHIGKWHVPGREVRDSFTVLFDGDSTGLQGDSASVRTAEGFLNHYRGEEPFLLNVGLLNPHDICFWPQLHNGARELPIPELAINLPPLPKNFLHNLEEPERVLEARRKMDSMGAVGWTERLWRYYIWAYYRYVEMVDGALGILVEALKRSSHSNNTIVIFASDHGDGHGRHRLGLKSYFYDSVARVPLIFSAPGMIEVGLRDSRHLVSGVDLAPTLCDYAGTPPPPKCSGLSLRPLLEGREVEWREYVTVQSGIDGRMIRTSDYKFIRYTGDPVEQLFDMKNDPDEMQNLVNRAEFSSIAQQMRDWLDHYESTLDNAPGPFPDKVQEFRNDARDEYFSFREKWNTERFLNFSNFDSYQ